jgi:hypothetical protein
MADDPIEEKRLTISEIEDLLNKENSWDDDQVIRILPNGEIQYATRDTPKLLTLRENLGGEYGVAASAR